MSRRPRSGKNFVWPSELDHMLWRTGTRTAAAARIVGRTERTVRDWRSGRRPVPRWAFELLRFVIWERVDTFRVHAAVWARPTDIDLRPCFAQPSANDPPRHRLRPGGFPPPCNTGGTCLRNHPLVISGNQS